MGRFSVGDRVMAIVDYPELNNFIYRGDQGTVCCETEDSIINVEWDKDVNGHDCLGHCKNRHGWRVKSRDLCLVELESDLEIEESSFMEVLKNV